MNDNKVIPFRHEILQKSNFFIGAKYKASALENQITYLAMLKIQENDYEERRDGFYVTMPASYIKNEVGNNSGSFYKKLKTVADDMTGNNIGVVDDEHERFDFVTMINRATYYDGEFTIRFALELRNYLINVQRDYTKVPKKIAMKLKKKAGSLPLYQILKQQCYYPSGYTGHKDYVFSVVIGLSELKLDIGVVNIKDSPDVKRALSEGKGTTADYDKAVAKSKDKMYDTWGEFDRKCLKQIIDEINEHSDIYVEYEKKTKGRGGKVYAVQFTVWLNGAEKDNKNAISVSLDEKGNISQNISDEDKFLLYMKIFEMFGKYNINYNDVTKIAESANFDLKKIENAYSILQSTGEVENVVGWVICCIKGEWEVKKKENNKFKNFQERKYSIEDMTNLEKTLLNQ